MLLNRCGRLILRKNNVIVNILNKNSHFAPVSTVIFSSIKCESKRKTSFHQITRFYADNSDQANESKNSHSEKEENEKENVNSVKVKILENAMEFVAEHGWTRRALSHGAEQAGYPGVAEGMFSGGGDDLVLYFLQKCNYQLLEYLSYTVEENKKKDEKIKTPDFIRSAVEYRLRMIIPYIDVWPQAMGILARPDIFTRSAEELAKMVDDIWFYAGDKSADINWYTKRGILAKLYGSTQLVMLTDQSPDFQDTWEFLDRRMNDIGKFTKISQSVKDSGNAFVETAVSGATVLKNIAGFGDRNR